MTTPGPSTFPPPPPPPGEWSKAPTPYDALSISALVCALTCCAAPAGVVLGILGLVRTRRGARRGRWAAITGLVVGAVLSVVLAVASVLALVALGKSAADDLDPATVSAGACITLDFAGDPGLASCTEPHDGEIAWVGLMTAPLMQEWREAEHVDDFCFNQEVAQLYLDAARDQDYTIGYWADTFWREPKQGAWMICYLTASEGTLLEPLTPREQAPA